MKYIKLTPFSQTKNNFFLKITLGSKKMASTF